MPYRIAGTSSLRAYLGDAVVYRKLVPADPRLPGFAELRGPLDLTGPYPPAQVRAGLWPGDRRAAPPRPGAGTAG